MINRIKAYIEEPEKKEPQGDFWVIYGTCGMFYVSEEVAREVEQKLDRRWWAPRWVRFTDLAGSRVRVLAREIQSVYESTAEQRTTERAFHRARREEDKADRLPWEDDF